MQNEHHIIIIIIIAFAAGVVYNITAYLSFHPGSVAELMKGAGIDCTTLFNNVSDDHGTGTCEMLWNFYSLRSIV